MTDKLEKQIENTDRMELAGKFVGALLKDFKKHGKQAIEDVRTKSPGKYLDLVANAIPKEAKEQKHLHLSLIKTLKDLSNHELDEEVVTVVPGSDIICDGGSVDKENGVFPKGSPKSPGNPR